MTNHPNRSKQDKSQALWIILWNDRKGGNRPSNYREVIRAMRTLGLSDAEITISLQDMNLADRDGNPTNQQVDRSW